MPFKFEELRVWQFALSLTTEVDRVSKKFPREELFILSSQIKRASDSVVLNIAEGSTGQSKKEFSRFLSIAIRSAIEVVTCLHVGKNRNIIDQSDFDFLYSQYESLIKQIFALRKSLEN